MSSAVRFRAAVTAAAAVLLLGSVAGCGADLARSNFQRTTVPPEPGGSGGTGPAPAGEITDAAVSAKALRLIEPCALLSAETFTGIGTPAEPRPSGWDRCAADVTDAGQKKIKISLEIGGIIIGPIEDAKTAVEGLPQLEKKDGDTCTVTAVTSKEPKSGIVLQVDYIGGDPCGAGRTAMQRLVKNLHSNPKKHPEPPGTVVGVDACASVDTAVVAEALGGKPNAPLAVGLHGCSIRSRTPQVMINFRPTSAPAEEEGSSPVDLGGGVQGFAKTRVDDEPECTVTWQHRVIGKDEYDLDLAEQAEVDYNGGDGTPESDKSCDKAVKVAKSVVAKLPKA
ncbi:DUF3558 domain-containing protein [Amycolatopsis magusensis]|uniref:DUF3558 domain-containing protein n=1 Tax=Amycolatopsis magusensis TaxID=882444 RepID=UPI00378BFC17